MLKNLVVNLHAAGPAAVVCVWAICITVIAVLGSGGLAFFAIGILSSAGVTVITAMIQYDPKDGRKPD
jgi:hypothetical protein